MNENALGLIEVIGYPAALEAADTCVKSSHVKLLGYEKARDGRIVVKITGDVGAVKAAVEGAKNSAGKLGTVIAAMVIAHPAEGIGRMVHSPETVFTESGAEQTPVEPLEETAGGKTVADPEAEQAPVAEATDQELRTEPQSELQVPHSEPPMPQQEQQVEQVERKEVEVGCNLCGDPLCRRMKGQPVTLCLHHRPRPAKTNKDGQP
ncbi:BMC domain-containing protein [Paenibacillus macerans]|uniref:BMC domain-containing protein n=1 Tax=Paenibacillus macerans TaxID=44252 RepID=UPI00203F10DB|nr:BMC domain-containing protein [Paenibacillus macerans]MCM3700677.1 BMC domain-containing protein [Paenibacillus macerans]